MSKGYSWATSLEDLPAQNDPEKPFPISLQRIWDVFTSNQDFTPEEKKLTVEYFSRENRVNRNSDSDWETCLNGDPFFDIGIEIMAFKDPNESHTSRSMFSNEAATIGDVVRLFATRKIASNSPKLQEEIKSLLKYSYGEDFFTNANIVIDYVAGKAYDEKKGSKEEEIISTLRQKIFEVLSKNKGVLEDIAVSLQIVNYQKTSKFQGGTYSEFRDFLYRLQKWERKGLPWVESEEKFSDSVDAAFERFATDYIHENTKQLYDEFEIFWE